MNIIKTGWNFFQDEILGMQWLNRLIGSLLDTCGIDTTGKIGGSVRFFLYDFAYFVYSELLSARKNKENSRTVSWHRG